MIDPASEIPINRILAETAIKEIRTIPRVDITPSLYDAWVDIDCSSFVPEGTVAVFGFFAYGVSYDSSVTAGVRKNGNTDIGTRVTASANISGFWSMFFIVELDENLIFEAYLSSGSIHIVGYIR